MRQENLTPREVDTLVVLKRFIAEHGWAPTVQELSVLLGLRSKSWAYNLLVGLEQKGYISLGKGPRMIRIKSMHPDSATESEEGARRRGKDDPYPTDR